MKLRVTTRVPHHRYAPEWRVARSFIAARETCWDVHKRRVKQKVCNPYAHPDGDASSEIRREVPLQVYILCRYLTTPGFITDLSTTNGKMQPEESIWLRYSSNNSTNEWFMKYQTS